MTIMGFGGISLSVTRGSRNTTSAFKLLSWLGSGETATRLSRRSRRTIWFRSSQVAQAHDWLDRDSRDHPDATRATRLLSAAEVHLLPRIPEIDTYLLAVSEAVTKVLAGDATVEAALQAATQRWEAITEQMGRDRQRAAYRKHLGLDPSLN